MHSYTQSGRYQDVFHSIKSLKKKVCILLVLITYVNHNARFKKNIRVLYRSYSKISTDCKQISPARESAERLVCVYKTSRKIWQGIINYWL